MRDGDGMEGVGRGSGKRNGRGRRWGRVGAVKHLDFPGEGGGVERGGNAVPLNF